MKVGFASLGATCFGRFGCGHYASENSGSVTMLAVRKRVLPVRVLAVVISKVCPGRPMILKLMPRSAAAKFVALKTQTQYFLPVAVSEK